MIFAGALSADPEVLAIVEAAFAAVGPRPTRAEAVALAFLRVLDLERAEWARGNYGSPYGPAADMVHGLWGAAIRALQGREALS